MPPYFRYYIIESLTGNVQVTHSNAENDRSESVIAVNPLNKENLVCASKKFIDPHTYHFTLGVSASFDGGAHWQESSPLILNGGWDVISDPALAWDKNGHVYLVALPASKNSSTDYAGTCLGIVIYKSSDGGLTWSTPTVIHSSTGDDKQWAEGDNSTSSPHYGNIYTAWDDGSLLRYARSTNSGATWKGLNDMAVTDGANYLANDSFSPEITVAPDGSLYIVWWTRYGFGGTKYVKFVKSTDGGKTFSSPQIIASGITDIESVMPFTDGWAHFPGGTFRVLTMATCTTGSNGELIVAWSDAREKQVFFDGTKLIMIPHSRIYYRRSIDGGNSWEGDPSGIPLLKASSITSIGYQHFHPQIIRDARGNIGCAFYEFGFKNGKYAIDVLLSVSIDGGQTFDKPKLVTDQPFDPAVNAPWAHGDSNVTFIGEYFGLNADDEGFDVLWTDTRTGVQELFFNQLALKSPYVIDVSDISELEAILVSAGVTEDGGGIIILANGHIIKVPPRGPVMEILKNVNIISDGLELSNGKEKNEILSAAFKKIEEIGEEELKSI